MQKGLEICRRCNGKGCIYCDEKGTVDWIDNIVDKPIDFEDRMVKILVKEISDEIDNDILKKLKEGVK